MNDKLISPTYGELTIKEVKNAIKEYLSNTEYEYEICIGTDSMGVDKNNTNYEYLKNNKKKARIIFYTVICIRRIGKGGIYFYKLSFSDKPMELTQKLFTETMCSLSLADEFSYLNPTIHIDISEQGKSKSMFNAIKSYVQSLGYKCVIKPESYVSSSIADRLTK